MVLITSHSSSSEHSKEEELARADIFVAGYILTFDASAGFVTITFVAPREMVHVGVVSHRLAQRQELHREEHNISS